MTRFRCGAAAPTTPRASFRHRAAASLSRTITRPTRPLPPGPEAGGQRGHPSRGERHFRTIFDGSNDAILVVDAVGDRVLDVNPEACRMLGYDREELLSLSVADLHPNEVPKLRAFAGEIAAEGRGRTGALTWRANTGVGIPVELSASMIDLDGRPAMVMVARDLTARRRAADAFRARTEEAEAANRAKSEFLANMTHELRTPLNAIIGFSAVMGEHLKASDADPKLREYNELVNTSGYHLLDLINDVLDMSKIEAGRLEVSETTLDIAELAGGCIDLMKKLASDGRVTLSHRIAGDLPDYRGDKRKLKQIILNLLANAIKFTAPDGAVEIRVGRIGDGELAIVVADNGVGIAAEDIPKAMARFGQVSTNIERSHEGTGLGLPLAIAFAELHGGAVELESEPGVGTTVTVRLPGQRFVLAGRAERSAA